MYNSPVSSGEVKTSKQPFVIRREEQIKRT